MPDPIVRELAMKRWERDRALTAPQERDPMGLGQRGPWDDRDHLCRVYLEQASRDVANDAVTDFQRYAS